MFHPKYVLFEKHALEYKLGKSLYKQFNDKDVNLIVQSSNRLTFLPKDPVNRYKKGKQLLIVGHYKEKKFQSCKPSADYQLPLVSGCMGGCEYCYLNTNFADRPYTKIYVNIKDILKQTQKYIDESEKPLMFEGSATSDPVPVEGFNQALEQTILFFSKQETARFRFVTKYTDVDSFLELNHQNKTEIRFSINTDTVINNFEHLTPSFNKRLEAAHKIIQAKYPVGFLIAPIVIYDGWKDEYRKLIQSLKEEIKQTYHPITFEIITHRYTTKAKNHIMEIYPETLLDMNDANRTYKFGQFGYGKFIYHKETMKEVKEFFQEELKILPFEYEIKYII